MSRYFSNAADSNLGWPDVHPDGAWWWCYLYGRIIHIQCKAKMFLGSQILHVHIGRTERHRTSSCIALKLGSVCSCHNWEINTPDLLRHTRCLSTLPAWLKRIYWRIYPSTMTWTGNGAWSQLNPKCSSWDSNLRHRWQRSPAGLSSLYATEVLCLGHVSWHLYLFI